MKSLNRALIHLFLGFCLSGCLAGGQRTSTISGPVVVGPATPAGGDGEAIHGGDPDELVLDEIFGRLTGVLAKIQRGELNGRIGQEPEACAAQPLALFCDTLNLSIDQRDFLESFLETSAPHTLALLGSRGQFSIHYTKRSGALLTQGGQTREVLAWIEITNGKPVILLQDSIRYLGAPRILALLAHELLHLTYEVSDQQAVALFPSLLGDGRRLADTAGAAIASLAYLSTAVQAPTLLGLYIIGGRSAELKQVGSTYVLVNENGSTSRAEIHQSNGSFSILALDWNNLVGQIDYRGTIIWGNGSLWSPNPNSASLLGLVGDYIFTGTNQPARVEWTGQELRFINENGSVSAGSLITPTLVSADGWNHLHAQVDASGNLLWDNLSRWNRVR